MSASFIMTVRPHVAYLLLYSPETAATGIGRTPDQAVVCAEVGSENTMTGVVHKARLTGYIARAICELVAQEWRRKHNQSFSVRTY